MRIDSKYKNTEIGVIPIEWDVKNIKDAFDIHNNFRLPISEDNRKKIQGIYPYYGPTRIQDYLNEYRINGEYALIGEDGDHFLKFNEMAMTQFASGKFNVNNHAHIVMGMKGIATTKWFYYFFKHRDITKHLTRQGAGRYKLTKKTLLEILCAIPPTVKEQNEVTEILSDIENLINKLEKLIDKKRNIKQGAMQELLRPKNNWLQKELGDIFYLKQGIQCEINKQYFEDAVGLKRFIRIVDLTNSDEPSRYIEDPGPFHHVTKKDLFMVRYGAPGLVGYGFEGVIANNLFRLIPKKRIEERFFYHLFCYRNFDLKQLSSSTTMPALNFTALRKLYVSYPEDCNEQLSISIILSDMNAEISLLKSKLEKYKYIKQGMMQNLLTGRIRLV